MRIIEVRDSFIKAESDEKLELTSFLKVNSDDKCYIAQIVQVKNAGNVYVIIAKLVYLYDGNISKYDNSLPSKDSLVEKFDFVTINKSFDIKLGLTPAKYITGDNLVLDKDVLESLLISADNKNSINTLLDNITKQTKKSVIIDMQGNIESENKQYAGSDFKLPLNSRTFSFIYEACLNDVTAESKSVIKEIFKDLSDYSKTVEFLSFKALKTIVDNMVDKEHIFKLLALKTKLAKFEKCGYFASVKSEVDKLSDILKTNNAVIDLSKLDAVFKNKFLSTILENSDNEALIFLNVDNSISKMNLKDAVKPKSGSVVLICNSKFKYLNDIKSMYKNFVIEPSFTNNSVFKPFAPVLTGLANGQMMFVGEASDRLPLVILDEKLETLTEELINEAVVSEVSDDIIEATPEEIAIDEKNNELISQLSDEVENTSVNAEEGLFAEDEAEIQEEEVHYDTPLDGGNDYHTSVDSTKTIAVEGDVLELEEEPEQIADIEEEVVTEELPEQAVSIEENVDEVPLEPSEDNVIDMETADSDIESPIENTDNEVVSLDEDAASDAISEDELISDEDKELTELKEDDDSDFDEIVELDDSEISDSDILVDLEDEEFQTENAEDELDKEIVEDVDKVYTTMKDDTISDEDLDFIDELNSEINSDDEELTLTEEFEPVEELQEEEEEGFIEPLEEVGNTDDVSNKEILETKNSETTIVPVYDADIPQEDRVVSDPIEQGDTVVHAKYGTGVVEKMIKYGSKNLYSINFDNVGRRLLDPTLTEIKKA